MALSRLSGGGYVGSIVALEDLLSALVGQGSQPAIVVNLDRCCAVQPLRRRIQGFIDRRFYRRKYDARKTLKA